MKAGRGDKRCALFLCISARWVSATPYGPFMDRIRYQDLRTEHFMTYFKRIIQTIADFTSQIEHLTISVAFGVAPLFSCTISLTRRLSKHLGDDLP